MEHPGVLGPALGATGANLSQIPPEGWEPRRRSFANPTRAISPFSAGETEARSGRGAGIENQTQHIPFLRPPCGAEQLQ